MKSSFIAVFALFLLTACSSTKTHVSSQELLQSIGSGKPPVIVDVRSQSEYEAGHVPGAIHIPFWSAFGADQLNKVDRSEELVIYCQHGPRAGIAKLAFKLSGFEKIYYLEGHMSGWSRAGLRVK